MNLQSDPALHLKSATGSPLGSKGSGGGPPGSCGPGNIASTPGPVPGGWCSDTCSTGPCPSSIWGTPLLPSFGSASPEARAIASLASSEARAIAFCSSSLSSSAMDDSIQRSLGSPPPNGALPSILGALLLGGGHESVNSPRSAFTRVVVPPKPPPSSGLRFGVGLLFLPAGTSVAGLAEGPGGGFFPERATVPSAASGTPRPIPSVPAPRGAGGGTGFGRLRFLGGIGFSTGAASPTRGALSFPVTGSEPSAVNGVE